MQGAERGPKWAGLERANIASHRTLLCAAHKKSRAKDRQEYHGVRNSKCISTLLLAANGFRSVCNLLPKRSA